MLAPEGPTVTIRLRLREDPTASVDPRAAHELWVHTNDPDEPKLALEYSLGSVSSRAPPKAR